MNKKATAKSALVSNGDKRYNKVKLKGINYKYGNMPQLFAATNHAAYQEITKLKTLGWYNKQRQE